MNRFAKKFRVLCSICVLLNLATLFVPVTMRVQEHYPDIVCNQLDYMQSAAARYIPAFAAGVEEIAYGLTGRQIGWVVIYMVLPLLLSLIAGIWGIVGSYSQKVSSVLVFVILILYIGMTATIGNLWPEAAAGQTYCRGFACTLTLIFSGCGVVLELAALIATPKKVEITRSTIPQVEEMKQQQVEAKYSIMMEGKQEKRQEPAHGVLVGITGIYAGAEISLAGGEYILIGRHSDNHLIFKGQPNVSRNHCRIRWDAGRQKYIFRDYSSNGSFANGSEDCLPQNLDLELEPGTTIAIGDESNTFRLK